MRDNRRVSPELGLVVLAVIFAFGIAVLAVTMIALLPGALAADSWLEEVRQRRRQAAGSTPDAADT
jgi:hypothetical protein